MADGGGVLPQICEGLNNGKRVGRLRPKKLLGWKARVKWRSQWRAPILYTHTGACYARVEQGRSSPRMAVYEADASTATGPVLRAWGNVRIAKSGGIHHISYFILESSQ